MDKTNIYDSHVISKEFHNHKKARTERREKILSEFSLEIPVKHFKEYEKEIYARYEITEDFVKKFFDDIDWKRFLVEQKRSKFFQQIVVSNQDYLEPIIRNDLYLFIGFFTLSSGPDSDKRHLEALTNSSKEYKDFILKLIIFSPLAKLTVEFVREKVLFDQYMKDEYEKLLMFR